MPTVLHVVDGRDPDELRLALEPLLRRVPRAEIRQVVAVMGPGVPPEIPAAAGEVHRPASAGGSVVLQGAVLGRLLGRIGADLVHAWSTPAAHAAVLASGAGGPRVLLSAWDPHIDVAGARRVNLLEHVGRIVVLCHAMHVRRRWIERGLDPERSAVVRPGVDFAMLNRHRRDAAVGRELGADRGLRVVLLAPHGRDRGGHLLGAWAMSAAHYLEPRLRLVVAGGGAGRAGLRRRIAQLPNAECVRFTGTGRRYEALLNWAEAVLLPVDEDVSTTALAWAMAAGVPVVACATYATSELLAHDVNGLLVMPGQPLALAREVLAALAGGPACRRRCEAARGQAFEAFGLTRYVEQVRHAWDNVLAGRAPGSGMTDSALDL